MKQDGIVVDSPTFKLLLDAFVRSGKFDFALELLDYMEELGIRLDPDMYNSVLVALVKKSQVGLALSMFYKLVDGLDGDGSGGFVVPDVVSCNELLVALRKADMRGEFERVFEKLREKGFEFDTWSYNICIHAFGCWGDPGLALKLFKEMKEKGPIANPDLCTYNSLIRVLFAVGKVNDAMIVWEELKSSGHEPDEFSYRTVIQGCCKSYRIEDAAGVFREMELNGFRPDTIVYNSLMDGLLKARKVADACQMFEKMVNDGVKASSCSYNILIDGLFRNGRAVAGYTLFCDLKKKGQFVDAITYSIVALHLCREGQLERALELVEEMEARGFVVDLVTISSLLISLHKHSRWDWAERLMKHVRNSNLVPNIVRWKNNMEASMKTPQSRQKDLTPLFPSDGDLSEIMRFIDLNTDLTVGANLNSENGPQDNVNSFSGWSSSPHMDRMADGSEPFSSSLFSISRGQRVQGIGAKSFDIDMVNTYMSIFLAKGKLSVACKLFEIFAEMGCDPVIFTYNTVLSSFIKKGYFKEVWGVLIEMKEKLCPADIATYNMIIQGLGKMGKADLASAVLDQLLKKGGYLDIVMYNTLIHALGKAGQIDEAGRLFKQMTASGINPDVVTFNTLIEVHTKAGRVKEAYAFLKMMLDAGCSPNHVTDTILDFLEKEIEKLRYQKASMKLKKEEFP